jgi:hypothetical protein
MYKTTSKAVAKYRRKTWPVTEKDKVKLNSWLGVNVTI